MVDEARNDDDDNRNDKDDDDDDDDDDDGKAGRAAPRKCPGNKVVRRRRIILGTCRDVVMCRPMWYERILKGERAEAGTSAVSMNLCRCAICRET